MTNPQKDPAVRRKPRPSRHPSIMARRRLKRRVVLGVLALALVAPLFLKMSKKKPPVDVEAVSQEDDGPGIAPVPQATLPVTRETLLERKAKP